MADITKLVCENFDLGTPAAYFTGTTGVSHEKTKIITNKGSFFVKCFKGMTDVDLRYVHDVEIYMQSKGIPVPQPVNATGALWIRWGDTAYKPYYFIDSTYSIKPSVTEYREMGVLLAKIHWAGSRDVPRNLFRREAYFPFKEDSILALSDIRSALTEKQELSSTDKSVIAHVDWKLSQLLQYPKELRPFNDSIIHGDFHPGNILYSEDKKIVAICDWDRTNFGSRSMELVSSAYLVCFRPEHTREEAFEYARSFVKGYHREYPISLAELQNGRQALLYSTLLNTVIEKEYIDQNRFDVERLLWVERNVIELCLDTIVLDTIFS